MLCFIMKFSGLKEEWNLLNIDSSECIDISKTLIEVHIVRLK